MYVGKMSYSSTRSRVGVSIVLYSTQSNPFLKIIRFEKKVSTVVVYNSINTNKAKNYLIPQSLTIKYANGSPDPRLGLAQKYS